MSGIWREKQNRVRELQKLRDARAHALRTADWMDQIGEVVPDEVYEELIRLDARIKQIEEAA